MTAKLSKRPPSVAKVCAHCGGAFSVNNARKDTAKFCSRSCSDAHPKKHNTVLCAECGTSFPLKKSQADKTVWGNFCSSACMSKARSRRAAGDGNPNWKGRNYDHDGYKLFTPQASLGLGFGKIKVHHAVSFSAVGITKMPKGMHVHHRDCNNQNNAAHNLQFLTISDHRWIHKQYGSATLWAIANGKIDISDAASWSDDPIRATGILFQDVESQGAIFRYFQQKNISTDIAKISAIKPVRVQFLEVTELKTTERGAGGFGHTGV